MAARFCSEQYTRSIREGYLKHNYVRTYKVDVINGSLVSTCNDANLPVLGSSISLEGITYWAVEHVPRRVNDEGGRSLAMVDVIYTNDSGSYARDSSGQPIEEPANMAPYVQVQWNTRMIEQAGGYFVRIEDDDGNSVKAPPYLEARKGLNTMLVNSAGVPNGTLQAERHFKQITYWTFHRTWEDDWDDGVDTTNRSAFTITQRDVDGIRYQYSVSAKRALFVDLIKEDHWMGQRLYFRRGVVMQLDREAWIHRAHDRGMQWSIFGGSGPNGTGNDGQVNWYANPQRLFTQQELSGNNWLGGFSKGLHVITATDAQTGKRAPISEPMPLNGYGAPQWSRRPESLAVDTTAKNYYLIYDPYETSDWSTTLGIE